MPSSSSSAFAWDCEVCSYHHQSHGRRCVMCGHVRGAATKEEMIAFVTGGKIPRREDKQKQGEKTMQETVDLCSQDGTNAGPIPPPSLPLESTATTRPSTRKRPPVQNPYTRSSKNGKGPRLATDAFVNETNGRPSRQPSPNPYAQSKRHPSTPSDRNSTTVVTSQTLGIGQEASIDPASGTGIDNSSISQQPQQIKDQHLLRESTNRDKPNDAQHPSHPFAAFGAKPPKSRKQRYSFPYRKGPIPLNLTAAETWIYPLHPDYPTREYQLQMATTSIFYNTLVSLPTGLGKTLIASVVLFNYYRWFPLGKVVFLAPTLPLVNQQLDACYRIMGIPSRDTAILTGKLNAADRKRQWEERRVFFCTPQTVYNDIITGRCPAKSLVCIVLDEAHKASGAYAYVKVIEEVEKAGAKFRIIGLSATPGTEIKTIQKVLDALRINRIEARFEDDPSVKQYIHERRNEIILVKQVSAVTTIERLLGDLIAEPLEKLRKANVLQVRGNSTLTPYCLVRAMENHKKDNGNPNMMSLFLAAHQLVSIRCDLRRHGIGVARSKLDQAKYQPKHYMKSISQSEKFRAVYDHVVQASYDPKSKAESVEDRMLNNPKLMKLNEILQEHFRRKEASNESTRAIVFSQLRDSVGEIVSVLNGARPLLKPRAFVGQGKSVATSKDDATTNGMKQKEQQKAIREFKDGLFNILVCTCIGEEGLDIGEVDLIVNYDTLRSPIRMIQRVGRTGRRRDGRVVFLVSEGEEEKKLKQSKQQQKTLCRAMKRKDNFTFCPNEPMFMEDPLLKMIDVSKDKVELAMSQVGGYVKSRSVRCNDENDFRNQLGKEWRLSEVQEYQRSRTLGPIKVPHEDSFLTLRKHLLRARSYAASKDQCCSQLSKFLRKLESVEGRNAVVRPPRKRKRNRPQDRSILSLFPLQSHAPERGLTQLEWTQQLNMSQSQIFHPPSTVRDLRTHETQSSQLQRSSGQEANQAVEKTSTMDSAFIHMKNVMDSGENIVDRESEQRDDEPRHTSTALNGRGTVDKMRLPQKSPKPTQHLTTVRETEQAPDHSPTDEKLCLTLDPPSSSESEGEDDDDSHDEAIKSANSSASCFGTNVILLKKRSDAEQSDIDQVEAMASTGSPIYAHDVFRQPRLTCEKVEHSKQEEVPNDVENGTSGIELRLPTQDSSSSEDEHSNKDEGDTQHQNDRFFSAHQSCAEGAQQSSATMAGRRVDKGSATDFMKTSPSSPHFNEKQLSKMLPSPPSTKLADSSCMKSTSEIAIESCNQNDHFNGNTGHESEDEFLVKTKKRKKQILLSQESPADRAPSNGMDLNSVDLEDTPHSMREAEGRNNNLRTGTSTPSSFEATPTGPSLQRVKDHARRNASKSDDALTDTPASADAVGEQDCDVVCSVCHSGDVSSKDPLIICDGPNLNGSCDVIVHASCYRISMEDIASLDTWQCDRCKDNEASSHKKRSGSKRTTRIFCSLCQKSDGLLKKSSDGSWRHSICWFEGNKTICQICKWTKAVKCYAEGCKATAHPFCGVNDEQSPWQLLRCEENQLNIACCSKHGEEIESVLQQMEIPRKEKLPQCIMLPSDRFKKRETTSRLKRKVATEKPHQTKKTRFSLEAGEATPAKVANKKAPQKRQMKERQEDLWRSNFIDAEAAVDTDEDVEGDDEEIADQQLIEEEEELHSSFINDSSQLGYSQDELDLIDADARVDDCGDTSGMMHREVDAAENRRRQFATPIFNRRMVKEKAKHEAWSSGTRKSESQRGLGNMHFIRSVIEHHRNGGDADELEEYFHEVADDVARQEQDDREQDVDEENQLPETPKQEKAKRAASYKASKKKPHPKAGVWYQSRNNRF